MTDTVESYMASELVTLAPGDHIIHAMRLLLERHFSGAPVIDDSGNLVGMLSQKDCLAITYRTAYHQDWGGRVEDYMSRQVECIDADTPIPEAVEKFLGSPFRRFPVLRDGRLVGLISRHDMLRALDEQFLGRGGAR